MQIPQVMLEEVFSHLPLPYVDEEFKIGAILKDVMENKTEPSPFIHIRHNIYLVKKKHDGAEANVGWTNCNASSTWVSQSAVPRHAIAHICAQTDPSAKRKKIKIVKLKHCGWGVVALQSMEKRDFVIEYIGEVFDDALCEQTLWDMKHRGDQNFYMCEIHKDFTSDATFKGNTSQFLNHSYDPNCKLEKWYAFEISARYVFQQYFQS